MALLLRRCLACVAACGLAAALATYVDSFIGATFETVFRWAIFLHLGIFALLVPMYAVEYSRIEQSKFFWDAIWRGPPRWGVRAIQLAFLFFAIHFLLFLLQSHAASPEIQNGRYVLNNHGQIVRELTASEYRWLKGSELRLFATGWLSFYSALLLYWWFPRPRSGEVS